MFVVAVRVRGRTPLVPLALKWPGTGHRIEDLSPEGNRCTFSFREPATAPEAAGTCLESCTTAVASPDGLSVTTTCRTQAGAPCILRDQATAKAFLELRGRVVLHAATPGNGTVELVLVARGEGGQEVQSALQQAFDAAGVLSVVSDPQPLTVPSAGEIAALRPIERDTLAVALSLGYYDSPRKCTMDDIGRVLGISKSAVYHRLSTIEGKALRDLAERSRVPAPPPRDER